MTVWIYIAVFMAGALSVALLVVFNQRPEQNTTNIKAETYVDKQSQDIEIGKIKTTGTGNTVTVPVSPILETCPNSQNPTQTPAISTSRPSFLHRLIFGDPAKVAARRAKRAARRAEKEADKSSENNGSSSEKTDSESLNADTGTDSSSDSDKGNDAEVKAAPDPVQESISNSVFFT